MMELLKNAWMGWENYIQENKLVILLLVTVCYFVFYKKEELQKSWVRYTALMTICCVTPVTAVVLMQYQTRFYDYAWIWSAVPVTAMIACGITSVLFAEWMKKDDKAVQKAVGTTALILLTVFLCGSLGQGNSGYVLKEKEATAKIAQVAEELREKIGDEADVCLWAPMEVMEDIRTVDGEITLIYGRNIWDVSLNAYAYDTYSSEVVMLSRQMEQWDTKKTPETIAKMAKNVGVNCILLPIETDKSIVMRMANQLNVVPQTLEAYWLLYE